MKLKKLVWSCFVVVLLAALLFLPISPVQESRSVSPTGKGTLVALTTPRKSQSGLDNSSTNLSIEDSTRKRTLWFRSESGLFQPSDYVWSKDGSIIATKLGWSSPDNEKGLAQGKDYLMSVDVLKGEKYDVGVNSDVSPPPSPTQLQMISQILAKRSGAVAATWSAPKKLSWFQLFTSRRE